MAKKINYDIAQHVAPVNTEGRTAGEMANYQAGALARYTPKYQGGIDDTLTKIDNYGSYTSKYQPQIDATLNRVLDNTPYASRYQDQIDKYVNLMDQEYDPNSDATYLAYKNQYLRGGQKAMQDTLAKAVALSGGYDNSYANSVAQQQYGEYTAALADRIPELAQAAQDMYMNRLGMYRDLDNTDYSRWSDTRNNYYNQLSALQNVDNTAYGRWSDDRANLYDQLNAYQNLEQFNYGKFKDEYSMWEKAYAQQKALEDAAAAAAAASYGGGGYGGGSDYGNAQILNNTTTNADGSVRTIDVPGYGKQSTKTLASLVNSGKVSETYNSKYGGYVYSPTDKDSKRRYAGIQK